MVDREPLPEDGPDYHTDHAFWVERQKMQSASSVQHMPDPYEIGKYGQERQYITFDMRVKIPIQLSWLKLDEVENVKKRILGFVLGEVSLINGTVQEIESD